MSNSGKGLFDWYRTWRRLHSQRRRYSTLDRKPFFVLAIKYLPRDDVEIGIDIGSGEGLFAEYARRKRGYRNLILLEANESSVAKLRTRFKQVLRYRAPERLPFDDGAVSYVHCSHLVEHLESTTLYKLLGEIDRVLKPHGFFVLSAPLLWSEFYSDLSHVRPYNPHMFLSYLSRSYGSRTAAVISDRYSLVEIVYRYAIVDPEEGWGAASGLLDLLLFLIKRFVYWMGLRKYTKNGFTMILRKTSRPVA